MPQLSALRAVALLELLARAAPARVVAAELLVLARPHGLRDDARSRGDTGRDRLSPPRGGDRLPPARGADRLRAGRGLVLVVDVPVRGLRLRELLLGLLGRELGMEEVKHDL